MYPSYEVSNLIYPKDYNDKWSKYLLRIFVIVCLLSLPTTTWTQPHLHVVCSFLFFMYSYISLMELLCNMSPMLHVPRPQVCPLRLSLLPSLIPSLILYSHLALAHLRPPLHCRPIHRVITDTLSSLFAFIYMSLSCFLCTILILSPGCDFNGPIWNITGVPTAGDDVIITSDVQTTIFANSTSISLNSLWIGGNGTSAAITIVLTNCVLNITESTSMSYTSSCLHLNLISLPESRWHLTLSFCNFLLVFPHLPCIPLP